MQKGRAHADIVVATTLKKSLFVGSCSSSYNVLYSDNLERSFGT
jgi:hypothetical protein